MKKIVFSITMAFAFALPILNPLMAEPYYVTKYNSTWVTQNSFGRGETVCTVGKGTKLHRSWGENWREWIYVDVISGPEAQGLRSWFGCDGWVPKSYLDPIKTSATPTGTHTEVTNADVGDGKKWQENLVPIFKYSPVVFKARDDMRDRGNYDSHKRSNNYICRIPVGTKVQFVGRDQLTLGSVRVRVLRGQPLESNCRQAGWISEWNLNWR